MSLQCAQHASIERRSEADMVAVPYAGQENMAIAFEKRNVPLDFNSEALVTVLPHGKIGAEEDSEVDIGLLRNPAQERRLVLNGMTDQICQPDRARWEPSGMAARHKGRLRLRSLNQLGEESVIAQREHQADQAENSAHPKILCYRL